MRALHVGTLVRSSSALRMRWRSGTSCLVICSRLLRLYMSHDRNCKGLHGGIDFGFLVPDFPLHCYCCYCQEAIISILTQPLSALHDDCSVIRAYSLQLRAPPSSRGNHTTCIETRASEKRSTVWCCRLSQRAGSNLFRHSFTLHFLRKPARLL